MGDIILEVRRDLQELRREITEVQKSLNALIGLTGLGVLLLAAIIIWR